MRGDSMEIVWRRGGEKSSITMREHNALLYVFENKKGVRCVFDGLRSFAKHMGIDVSNLYRTLKHQNYYAGGWRVVEVFNLLKPDWDKINKKIRSCKVVADRIYQKLDDIERGILSLKVYGTRAWKSMSSYIKGVVKDDYEQEKMNEREQEVNRPSRHYYQDEGVVKDETDYSGFGTDNYTLAY